MEKNIFDDTVDWDPKLNESQSLEAELVADRFRSIASIFRAVRKVAGLSQIEAAGRLGVTQANISKMEKKSGANVDQLKALLDGTGYEVVVLIRGHGRDLELA